MTPSTNPMRHRPVVPMFLAAVLLPGCSGSSGAGGTDPVPVSGGAYSRYLPMQPGDLYECQSGLVLRVERATESNLGTTDARRIVVDDGGYEFGFYWSEVPGGPTLHHGSFDVQSNRQVVLPAPQPMFFGPTKGRSVAAVDEYDTIDAPTPAREGSLVLTAEDPSAGLHRPLWYSRGSLYGTVYQHELLLTRWTFEHHDVEGSYVETFALWSNPGYGPLTIVVGNTVHQVVRAVVDGVEYR